MSRAAAFALLVLSTACKERQTQIRFTFPGGSDGGADARRRWLPGADRTQVRQLPPVLRWQRDGFRSGCAPIDVVLGNLCDLVQLAEGQELFKLPPETMLPIRVAGVRVFPAVSCKAGTCAAKTIFSGATVESGVPIGELRRTDSRDTGDGATCRAARPNSSSSSPKDPPAPRSVIHRICSCATTSRGAASASSCRAPRRLPPAKGVLTPVKRRPGTAGPIEPRVSGGSGPGAGLAVARPVAFALSLPDRQEPEMKTRYLTVFLTAAGAMFALSACDGGSSTLDPNVEARLRNDLPAVCTAEQIRACPAAEVTRCPGGQEPVIDYSSDCCAHFTCQPLCSSPNQRTCPMTPAPACPARTKLWIGTAIEDCCPAYRCEPDGTTAIRAREVRLRRDQRRLHAGAAVLRPEHRSDRRRADALTAARSTSARA